MLPEDMKRCKEAALDSAMKTQQTVLGDHFGPPEEVIPYSNRAFEAATIEWLVQTNQVHIFVSQSLCLIFCHFSQSTRSSIQLSRRCWILRPEQAVASHYCPPKKLVHASFTLSSSKCFSYGLISMYVLLFTSKASIFFLMSAH